MIQSIYSESKILPSKSEDAKITEKYKCKFSFIVPHFIDRQKVSVRRKFRLSRIYFYDLSLFCFAIKNFVLREQKRNTKMSLICHQLDGNSIRQWFCVEFLSLSLSAHVSFYYRHFDIRLELFESIKYFLDVASTNFNGNLFYHTQ